MKKILAALLVLVFAGTLVFANHNADKTAARWDKIIATAEGYAYKLQAKYGSSPSVTENTEKMALLNDLWAEIKEMKEIRSQWNTESSRKAQISLIEDFRQSVFEAHGILTEIDREYNDLRN